MTSNACRAPFAGAAVVLALALCHRPAYGADKPKVAYLGSEGRDLESDLRRMFDEAVWRGLRDTHSVQPVAVATPLPNAGDQLCISQACTATAAAHCGAQFFFKAVLVETVQQGSPSYHVKLVAVQAA